MSRKLRAGITRKKNILAALNYYKPWTWLPFEFFTDNFFFHRFFFYALNTFTRIIIMDHTVFFCMYRCDYLIETDRRIGVHTIICTHGLRRWPSHRVHFFPLFFNIREINTIWLRKCSDNDNNSKIMTLCRYNTRGRVVTSSKCFFFWFYWTQKNRLR